MNKDGQINWGDYFICVSCGARVERGIFNVSQHSKECSMLDLEMIYTEDADFEVIEPKQLNLSNNNPTNG